MELTKENVVDSNLLEKFQQEIWNKVPHLEDDQGKTKVVNATPLIDLTADLKVCAKNVYNLNLDDADLKVFGKFDSNLPTGSIKVRPAVHIINDAITSGKLKSGETIIEATSGNFGIALGKLSKLGLNVVALVSRRLQEGVFEELRNENIRIIDLDMDICPAPGMKDSPNLLAAKATAANIRSQLFELGFDPKIFDNSSAEIQSLLASQDIINLAKFLAKIYGCFCPEQYDNELNIDVHRTVTAVEIDQQLQERGDSLSNFKLVCTFGTGGTSGGLSTYVSEKYSKKSVHIVFPSAGQDVAGIRTKDKATGLKLYRPETYAGQHEVDFEQVKPLLKFFVDKGYDIGESSALALYAAIQMANFGGGGRFVVIVADGIQKYKKNLESMSKKQKRTRVSLEEAASNVDDYDKIIWIHTQYTPLEEGIELIAKSLGVDKTKISVPKARTVEQLLATQQIPEELSKDLQGTKGKSLLVCMAGNTSLMAVNVLAGKGVVTESLNGGITALPQGRGRQLSDLIREASE
ncbi:MAG: pyridoxal-phosphate dependent enzyme [Nitrosopumilus sp.]|nr:pyridoxal-phosphate dependent enzyme [Nitrosopumilus sp.]MDH3385114.1 pyridoxal-phosphate dependent enzyme [Nitrosopumilus sp.]